MWRKERVIIMAIPAYYSLLQRGSSGPDVALVQTWLNGVRDACTWYGELKADGKFGISTENAVKEFQLKNKMNVDGKVGANTWNVLYTRYTAKHGLKVPYPGIVLHTGSSGGTVRLVQQKLNSLGERLKDDGKYGAATAAAVQRILNSGHLPSALEITDSFTLRAARNYLGDSALPSGCRGHLIVEVDGRRPAVREELDSLCTLLEECGATGILRADTEAEAEAIWQLRREFSYSLKATGMTKLNEDIVIPRSRLVALVEFCEALNRETGLDIACFGHSGDGNIHTNIMVDDYANPEKKALADACVDRLFHWVLAHGGAITGEHGIGLAKAKWFRKAVGEGAYHLHELVKSALDPKNLLNPGKMGLP